MKNGFTSVVLCSATASTLSVISNFDMSHMSMMIGNNYHRMPADDSKRFDELVLSTLPQEHNVNIVGIPQFIPNAPRPDKWHIPDRYLKMFSNSAQDDGQAEEWFYCTRRALKKDRHSSPQFHFNRLFQFIEAYHFFIKDSSGAYRIAFDVKNMNPEIEHTDRSQDIPTTLKRREKLKRLGCELMTVNMLRIDRHEIDGAREIFGVIDPDGNIIPSAIEKIKGLVNRK